MPIVGAARKGREVGGHVGEVHYRWLPGARTGEL